MTQLVWLRCDLRIHDNPALREASIAQKPVITVFISNPETSSYHDDAPCKLDFITRNISILKNELGAYNIPLVELECATYAEVPALLANFCEQHKVTDLYFNNQFEIDEQRRDDAVENLLINQEIKIHRFYEQTLVPPGMILSSSDQPLKVFTPFKKKWLQWKSSFASLSEVPLPEKQSCSPISLPNESRLTVPSNMIWPAGEDAALKALDRFLDSGIENYHIDRNFPAKEGTSRLSPYLAQGIISIKRVFSRLNDTPESSGKAVWINELIWREFYKHLIYLIPTLCCSKNFKSHVKFNWLDNPAFFKAWQDGKTGFPIIDAAMRQLKTTGWMHNRMRMNTAMFLSKLLNLDWRLGERHFMQNLIDGDLAANNGGWQWAAGTGADSAPYFRIFNPLIQSEKFDPHGDYIRKYCPELAEMNNKDIHAPHLRNPILAEKTGYPKPIIDYKVARQAYLDSRRNIQ